MWAAYLVLFSFTSICLASGLFYLAEWVEEYTVLTKKVIRWTIIVVVVLHLMLMILENLPPLYLLLGLVAHGAYFSLLPSFPYIEFTDPRFLVSVALAISDHCLWFWYFTQYYYPFSEILAFFVLIVWAVPFLFFLSLTANDSNLPGAGYGPSPSSSKKKGKGKGLNLRSLFSFLGEKKNQVMEQADPYASSVKLG